jgi:hypothetical protein
MSTLSVKLKRKLGQHLLRGDLFFLFGNMLIKLSIDQFIGTVIFWNAVGIYFRDLISAGLSDVFRTIVK